MKCKICWNEMSIDMSDRHIWWMTIYECHSCQELEYEEINK